MSPAILNLPARNSMTSSSAAATAAMQTGRLQRHRSRELHPGPRILQHRSRIDARLPARLPDGTRRPGETGHDIRQLDGAGIAVRHIDDRAARRLLGPGANPPGYP